ncbi:hypothetical protein F2Q69_00005517 [Brassica cretica]|uniref:F-box domain-containing protein n=1 Tax=Brassica cretica TaxID=69181 RepID=A0A8S9NWQ6_BRACR|nr:hypothetical protein F2Q69_00005517 [Brassica cretica]
MSNPQLQYLPDEILSRIVELVGQESAWYLGAFMRAEKRGYELVHQPSILKTCNVTPMVNKSPCEFGIYGNQSPRGKCSYDGLSSLVVGILYVWLGEDIEANNVF